MDYAKFGVSNLFCLKVIKEKPLWGLGSVNEGLRLKVIFILRKIGQLLGIFIILIVPSLYQIFVFYWKFTMVLAKK